MVSLPMSSSRGVVTTVVAPILLTATGGLLWLRAGVVVGQAGPVGAALLWAAVCGLTACTSVSLSAILTNAGSPQASTLTTIRASLGPGVAILLGLPMWVARVFGAAVAAFVLAESAAALAPAAILVALAAVVLGTVAARQGGQWLDGLAPIVLGVVAVGLASMVAGPTGESAGLVARVADYGGLLAYVVPVVAVVWVAPDALSYGSHRPSLQWTLGLAWLVQLAVLAWFARLAPLDVLATSPHLGIEGAAIPVVAQIGLVAGAAFAAIVLLGDGMVLVREVGEDAVPGLARPGAAALATGGLAAIAIAALRDLDGAAIGCTLAVLFGMTVINTVVAIEHVLNLTSFRPRGTVPPLVPVVGALGSASALLVVHPAGAIVLTAALMGATTALLRAGRGERAYSAVVSALGDWLARGATSRHAVRAWRPSMVVPVMPGVDVRGVFDLIAEMALPEGSVRFLGTGEATQESVDWLVHAAATRRLDAAGTTLAFQGADPIPVALEALKVAMLPPNLWVSHLGEPDQDEQLVARIAAAHRARMGVMLVGTPSDQPVIAARRAITLWVRAIPGRWEPLEGYEGRNLNLMLLMGYRLAKRWECQLRLVTVVKEPEHRLGAERFLASLVGLARLPPDTARLGIVGTFEQAVGDLSNADLDLFGLGPVPDLALARRLVGHARSTCVFVQDSGRESALV